MPFSSAAQGPTPRRLFSTSIFYALGIVAARKFLETLVPFSLVVTSGSEADSQRREQVDHALSGDGALMPLKGQENAGPLGK
jgi:hypothetical protein